ncbi:MAG: EVE domain-containing protein [Planctomycetota bacterium]|jgi:predicted RNA-binding protein with PUA-like domain
MWEGVRNYQARSLLHEARARETAGDPRWSLVDIKFVRAFEDPIPLADLKQMPALEAMALLERGSRLSIEPVASAEWRPILKRGR